jgi:hypothetical protein
MHGFPDPGPCPSAKEILTGDDPVLEMWWRYNVFKAVHDNDPLYRRWLADQIMDVLYFGGRIRASMREWLIFVLLKLQAEDRIPYLAKGRPIDRNHRYSEQEDCRLFTRSPNESVRWRLKTRHGLIKTHLYRTKNVLFQGF